MRHTIDIMGMPVVLDVPSASMEIFEQIHEYLIKFDQKYSTYKPDSEVSRYARGEIKQNDISKDLSAVISVCESYKSMTDGYFSAEFNGTFDPTGYTKALAIKEIEDILRESKLITYMISMGGDIAVASSGEKTWNLGVKDPRNTQEIMAEVSLKNGAIATSGNYERGAHIVDPHTGKRKVDLLSVTVIGPDIIHADVFATTIVSMGQKLGVLFLADYPEYEAIIVDHAGAVHSTSAH